MKSRVSKLMLETFAESVESASFFVKNELEKTITN